MDGPAAQHAEPRSSVHQLLELARSHLGSDMAFMSQFRDDQQVVAATATDDGAAMRVDIGFTTPLANSYCARVVDGTLSPVVTDARSNPLTRDLAITRTLDIGSYVGAPVPDGVGGVTGMVCCLSRSATPRWGVETARFLALIASLLGDVLRSAAGPDERRSLAAAVDDASALRAVLSDGEVPISLQPVVHLPDCRPVGYEALARFESSFFADPARAFAVAARSGRGTELELLAARSALANTHQIPVGTSLAVNLSAASLLSPRVREVLLTANEQARATGRGLTVEVTEHAPVADYEPLVSATRELRSAGVQLGVDDAGAGYASLRHVLQLQPDIIKIDITIIRSIDTDRSRQALTRSLVGFGREIGATLVAEGVETADEHQALLDLGVTHGQGYLYGRPRRPDVVVRGAAAILDTTGLAGARTRLS